jgi:exo-beta-1,3-glucanase (GH17 family)
LVHVLPRWRSGAALMALAVGVASAFTPSFAATPAMSSAVRATTAVCAHNAAAAPALVRLREAMEHGRFVAYEPASRQIVNGIPTPAAPDVIRSDLESLRERFDSLVTYSAVNGEEAIPRIAAALGYRALIIGVYDPFNATELNAAVAAAHANPKLVVGLSLGNELVFFHRHSAAEMEKLLDTVRVEIPEVALATTEPFHMFYPAEAAALLGRMDFLLPNVHPIFEPWFRAASNEDAAQFVVNVVARLGASYCGPILVKETGIPTAPQDKGYTEARQAAFYQSLQQRFHPSSDHAFAYFEAFDTPWRLNDYGPQGQRPATEEAHWGLYDERRQPKAVVALIAPLPRRPRGALR